MSKISLMKYNAFANIFGSPLYLILFVSDTCPNKCTHCWYNTDERRGKQGSDLLSTRELIQISKNVKVLEFLSLTGGEAFLRDDIVEIVDAFNTNCYVHRFDIPSSGFNSDLIVTKTEEILKILKGKPFRVDISIDGTENTHNLIRGNRKAFANAIQTLEQLKRLRRKYKNFDTSVISTISKYNASEVLELAKLIEELLPDGEWMVNIERDLNNKSIVSNEMIEAYNKANEYIANRKQNNNFSGDKGHLLGKILSAKNKVRRNAIEDILQNQNQHISCAAGSIAGVIFCDGEIKPCESMNYSLGNIRDYNYDIKKAWNSDKASKVRAEIFYSKCTCTHECFLSVSLLSNPSYAWQIIKNTFYS